MKTYDFLSRIGVILLAAVAPFICIITYGYLPSISSYWTTDLQPLFIITNALTSYFLYYKKNNNWRISALMLLLLTSFSVELYGPVHNVLAIGFFVANIHPLYKSNHYKWCLWLYLCSLPVLYWSMTFAEIVAIESLCIFHMLVLIKYNKLQKENDANAHLKEDKEPEGPLSSVKATIIKKEED